MSKKAVLLINFGGPETLAEVKPFLVRLFSDPHVLKIRNSVLRKSVAWIISSVREKKSQELYRNIGGGSPIRRLTDSQSQELQRHLRSMGRDIMVRTAFHYAPPFIPDVISDLYRGGIRNFLALPLFPQFSLTTTKGSLEKVKREVDRLGPGIQLENIRSFAEHPLFIDAHTDLIRQEMAKFPVPRQEKISILFSAHSIPQKIVTEEGDSYPNEVSSTIRAILKALKWRGRWDLGWQSKFGPVKWLSPSTEDIIRKYGSQHVNQVLVVPVSFVTDHLETLEEIDMRGKRLAQSVGIQCFKRTPGLNTSPLFIKALAEIIKSRKKFWGDN